MDLGVVIARNVLFAFVFHRRFFKQLCWVFVMLELDSLKISGKRSSPLQRKDELAVLCYTGSSADAFL